MRCRLRPSSLSTRTIVLFRDTIVFVEVCTVCIRARCSISQHCRLGPQHMVSEQRTRMNECVIATSKQPNMLARSTTLQSSWYFRHRLPNTALRTTEVFGSCRNLRSAPLLARCLSGSKFQLKSHPLRSQPQQQTMHLYRLHTTIETISHTRGLCHRQLSNSPGEMAVCIEYWFGEPQCSLRICLVVVLQHLDS